jgi:hypothetical protein
VDFQNGSRLSESDLDTAYQQGLFVAQEVSENASTNIEGIGPQGPQGIQGVAGNDGADGVSTTVALSESFESSEITVPTTVGNEEVSHGLGSVPKIFQVVIRCKTADLGYAVDDEVDVTSSGIQISVYSNSTVIGFTQKPSVYISHKDGSAVANITPANWKLVFRAFA